VPEKGLQVAPEASDLLTPDRAVAP
jgi:hypothetical protein